MTANDTTSDRTDAQAALEQLRQQQQNHRRGKRQFQELGNLFEKYELEDKGGYITQEFQDYGYRLACELSDQKHKSLYIKLAKEVDRGLLEKALSFVADADHARSKAKLFMWKLKQLREKQ